MPDVSSSPELATGAAPSLTVTLLGTGTSTGVPIIGCDCRTCTSDDPRDDRMRTSAHVVAHTEAGDVHLQIDTGPDFRVQALRFGVRTVDALLVTHEHFDHIVGLDDLRPFFFTDTSSIPVFAQPSTAHALAVMFRYVFDRTYPGASRLDLHEVDAPFTVASRAVPEARVEVTPVPAQHGTFPVLGFRIGAFAYLTDVNAIPESSLELLRGVDTLVLDGLRRDPHPSHFTFDQATDTAQRIGARDTVFIHMTHSVLHAVDDATLPEGIRLGYDGLGLSVAASP
ncbi:MAG: MBL fold metallo-hydrolase [Rubricoccaceae bacterium]